MQFLFYTRIRLDTLILWYIEQENKNLTKWDNLPSYKVSRKEMENHFRENMTLVF